MKLLAVNPGLDVDVLRAHTNKSFDGSLATRKGETSRLTSGSK